MSIEQTLKTLWSKTPKSFTVIGDIGLDVYLEGTVERISPEAPVPILRILSRQSKLGLAANVAANLAVLGQHASLVGVIGEDESGAQLLHLAKQAGIDVQGVHQDPFLQTIVKQRAVSRGQQLLRLDDDPLEPHRLKDPVFFHAALMSQQQAPDALILEDYDKGLLSPEIIQTMIHENPIPVFVDPHRNRPLQAYKGAFALTPNQEEASALTGIRIQDNASVQQAGLQILQTTNVKELLITRGSEGITLFLAHTNQKRPSIHHFPAKALEVFDVSGAGDTVIALYALCRMQKVEPKLAVQIANMGASIVVGKRGTATVTPRELYLRQQEEKKDQAPPPPMQPLHEGSSS
jgi:D-beta-D-heptose 7-phosphate kinase / D-beta-D-heptose 1-phosphate adenosyltransferase